MVLEYSAQLSDGMRLVPSHFIISRRTRDVYLDFTKNNNCLLTQETGSSASPFYFKNTKRNVTTFSKTLRSRNFF